MTEGTDTLVQRWADAWNSHDPDRVFALFTSDAVYEDVPSKMIRKGTELHEMFSSFLSSNPDFRVDDVSGFICGNEGLIRWTMIGTGASTDSSSRGVSVIDLSDGLIARHTDYWDGGKA